MQQYTQQEAEEILQRAVHCELEQTPGMASANGVTDADLVRMASELGISERAVGAALSQWRGARSEEEDRLAFERERKGDWTTHLTSYGIVNFFLMAMDLWLTHRLSFSVLCVLGWGIGMAFHTAATFQRGPSYEKEFRKWRKKRKSED
jgi:hypothetical protein